MKKEVENWIPTNPKYDPDKPMQVGGQAVIEGVMMRAPKSIATAVRRANGDVVVQKIDYRSYAERHKWLGIPILRGAVGLIDMMYLGIKSLNWSADIAMIDEEVKKEKPSKDNGKPKKEKRTLTTTLTLVLALIIGVGLFFLLPLYVTTKVFAIEQTAVAFNLIAGAIRIILLLIYLAAISFMKDVNRLFQYHGAEHKSVFAFELKSVLVPENVINFSRFHPRCGTSFLLIVVVVAIFSFSILDGIIIALAGKITLGMRLFIHLPFIPVVAGAAYEVIRFSAKHSTTWWGKIFIAPGLWLQKITTKEPDISQVEVALIALRCALGEEDSARYSLHIQKSVEQTLV